MGLLADAISLDALIKAHCVSVLVLAYFIITLAHTVQCHAIARNPPDATFWL